MLGGAALFGNGRMLAGRIAAKSGCRLLADTLLPRLSNGAGAARLDRLPYAVGPKIEALKGTGHITLVGCDRPVAFFAYPGKPSLQEPPGCTLDALCRPEMDVVWTLGALADALDAHAAKPETFVFDPPALPTGALTLDKVGAALAHLLPENAIVVNESVTAGVHLLPPLGRARPHDLLGGTGGAIGIGLPCASGAAVACPDRKVIALTGDGSAMYTLQSLWTMARGGLDVTVIVFANRGYQILRDELANVGVARYGANAQAMFDVEDPSLDWIALARGHGVPGSHAETMDDFAQALQASLSAGGPSLIEVVCPPA